MTPHDNVPAILERLIAFESISTSSNLDIIDYAKAWLESCGFRTHLLPDATGTKAGLVAQIGPDKPGGLVLSAHTDVVPVEGQNWGGDPFKLTKHGSRFLGRGTADMKGFLACVLAEASTSSIKAFNHPLQTFKNDDNSFQDFSIISSFATLSSTQASIRLAIAI